MKRHAAVILQVLAMVAGAALFLWHTGAAVAAESARVDVLEKRMDRVEPDLRQTHDVVIQLCTLTPGCVLPR